MSKPHLSHTQIEMLYKCPKQYEWRYVKGIRSPPGVAAVRGTGTHRGIEANLGNRLSTGSLLSLEAVQQAAMEGVREAWEREEPVLDEDEQKQGRSKVLGQTVDMAVKLASLHHKDAAPAIVPVALEQGFVIELDGFPFDILGYKDIVEANRIRDTKTKGKVPPANFAETSVQLAIYALDSHIKGEDVSVQMDVLTATASPKYLPYKAPKQTEQARQQLLRRVEVAAKQVESGIFPPCDPGLWACSAKWCGYWDRCEFGSRKAVSLQVIDPARLTSRLPDKKLTTWDDYADAA